MGPFVTFHLEGKVSTNIFVEDYLYNLYSSGKKLRGQRVWKQVFTMANEFLLILSVFLQDLSREFVAKSRPVPLFQFWSSNCTEEGQTFPEVF